ncbi:hypothetical protein AAV94_10880 [Lampropedia cohaerens]|uniref:Bifunctional NAD(P)H-hydrate repair enzyme n=2 Tax=Lampropedia cohaerens TaxID=1610491 RepID=A0A0U1PY50_9BURK|nr:hypothetical protein AAV94_10880 [Lampropedia cohaerens]
MAQADRAAMAAGIPGSRLMQRAGEAVARVVARRWQPCRVAVLCGPGNNGGDGWIAAAWLARHGWSVTVYALGSPAQLRGDARWAASQWPGPVRQGVPLDVPAHDLVIDALFGAGLTRALEGLAAQWLNAAAQAGMPICAVDVPSGLDGATGQTLGKVVPAAVTVTFARAKPGHWLLPGRSLCGELVVADIGIPDEVLSATGVQTWENAPGLWWPHMPRAHLQGHKYTRGHATILAGAQMTGAARLAARAAQRVGAGLVTVAAPPAAWPAVAPALESIMVQRLARRTDWQALLQDARRNAWLIGPGAGVSQTVVDAALDVLAQHRHLVLDADALTASASQARTLFAAIAASHAQGGQTVLTPHDGEFARLFSTEGSKLARASRAAHQAAAVVVLKGADTVIAAPDGRIAINTNAPPSLATAGSGDVLAGLITGLLAQGMPAFEAACAGVWLHGAAARAGGPCLVADDLPAWLADCLATWR